MYDARRRQRVNAETDLSLPGEFEKSLKDIKPSHMSTTWYDSNVVYRWYKKCVTYGVEFEKLYKAIDQRDYKKKIDVMKKRIQRMKQKLSLEDKTNLEKIKFNDFDQMSFHEQQRRAVMYDFESKTMLLHHKECPQCRRITLNHDKFNKTENLCQYCTDDDSKEIGRAHV